MNSTEFTLTLESRQDHGVALTPEDRRLLLGASLRLLGRRYSYGQPIFRDDVVRVASLADDSSERATR
jgi:hypothetical protein